MKVVPLFAIFFWILPLHWVVAKSKPCDLFYESLFREKKIKILVTYGYKDSRPNRFVGDQFERMAFVKKITSVCKTASETLCDFTRYPDNSERFTRQVKMQDGVNLDVEMVVVSSAGSPDDKRNRKMNLQLYKSQSTKRLFLDGFGVYDVILYNGHSRSGGGPDFFPPRLQKDLSVDYHYYKTEEPGFKDILNAIDEASKTRVFGLFSCASSKYFRKKILKKKKELALISSPNLLYYTDANSNLQAAIESLLKGSCQKSFNKSLKAGVPKVGSQIEFPQMKKPH